MAARRKPYKIITPQTWELIRAGYLSGNSASVMAARFGTTVWAIRKKAGLNGWTKLAYARALETSASGGPQPDPQRDPKVEARGPVKPFGGEATAAPPQADSEPPPADEREILRVTLARAGRMLLEGRGQEAQAMVRAAEGLTRLSKTAEEMDRAARQAPVDHEARRQAEWRRIRKLAEQLLTDAQIPEIHSWAVARWRAEQFGPDVAAQDYRRAVNGGWAGDYYNEDGTPKPEQSYEEFAGGFG